MFSVYYKETLNQNYKPFRCFYEPVFTPAGVKRERMTGGDTRDEITLFPTAKQMNAKDCGTWSHGAPPPFLSRSASEERAALCTGTAATSVAL